MKQKAKATTIIALSHICRTWRDAAVGCKWIWGCILTVDTSTSTWVDILLERAGSAPLYIYSNPTMSRTIRPRHHVFISDIWSALFDRVAQWKVLDLTVHVPMGAYLEIAYPRDTTDEILLSPFRLTPLTPLIRALTKAAPTLESFELNFPDAYYLSYARQGKFIPDTLFSGVTPRLKRFSFRDIVFSTLASFRTSKLLTHLDINWKWAKTVSITITEWLDILEGQTQLAFLQISGSFMKRDKKVNLTQRQIKLPSLRILRLEHCMDAEASVTLFSKLHVPHTCSVKLYLGLGVTGAPFIASLPVKQLQVGFERFITSWRLFEADEKLRVEWIIMRRRGFFDLSIINPQTKGLECEDDPMFTFTYMTFNEPHFKSTDVVNMVLKSVPEFIFEKTDEIRMDMTNSDVVGEELATFDRLFAKFEHLPER
ncbi:hypothetical protein BDN70DRAFT_870176 [Pholiota conissans]|uniref:F-box domain-containing protein n=1 Tax=Pholiota conissans TaxID=109636 RepID=A0A9P6D8A0_9AGAR|nr:hypothetical protein BDN70DRAFT_870176 [Pholiota conissans]